MRAEVNPNSSIGGKSLVPVVGTIIRLRSLGLFCFVLFCLGVIILRCRRLPKTGRGIAGNLSIDLNHFRSCNRKITKGHTMPTIGFVLALAAPCCNDCVFE